MVKEVAKLHRNILVENHAFIALTRTLETNKSLTFRDLSLYTAQDSNLEPID